GAGHEIELELDQLRRTEIIGLRPYTCHAGAQAALQRAERLPFQPIKRIAGGVSLRDRRSRQPLVPDLLMAIVAGEVELALPLGVERAAFGDERLELRIRPDLDRTAARLLRDEGGDCQQIAALKGKRRRLLMVGAAEIDALLEIDGPAKRLVER